MVLTVEELRAREYRRTLLKGAAAIAKRAQQLRGNEAAARALYERTRARIEGDNCYANEYRYENRTVNS